MLRLVKLAHPTSEALAGSCEAGGPVRDIVIIFRAISVTAPKKRGVTYSCAYRPNERQSPGDSIDAVHRDRARR